MKNIFWVLLLAVSFIGCSTFTFSNEVSSYDSNEEYNKAYFIIPSSDVENNQSLFREVSTYIKKTLSVNGFEYSDDNPEIILLVDYGIGGPQSHTNTNRNSITGQYYYTESTTYTRFLSLAAYMNDEYKNNETPIEIWRVDVTSTGSSSDIRRVLPYMVASTKDYIGKDSNGTKTVTLHETEDFDSLLK
jgi:hypothetical protein